jgi:hypothetical protein
MTTTMKTALISYTEYSCSNTTQHTVSGTFTDDRATLVMSVCKTDNCNVATSPVNTNANTLKCNMGQKGNTLVQENCPGGTCAVREKFSNI